MEEPPLPRVFTRSRLMTIINDAFLYKPSLLVYVGCHYPGRRALDGGGTGGGGGVEV